MLFGWTTQSSEEGVPAPLHHQPPPAPIGLAVGRSLIERNPTIRGTGQSVLATRAAGPTPGGSITPSRANSFWGRA